MPGYYYGIDYSYIVFVLPALIFALWAQFNVKTTFAKYSRVSSDKGMTGCDAARLILDRNGLGYVRIEQVAGDLTDHYDPKANVIRLSQSVYGAQTAAAVGVAAHEAGHAVQYAQNYTPIKVRSAIIPVTNLAVYGGIPHFPARNRVLFLYACLHRGDTLRRVGSVSACYTSR